MEVSSILEAYTIAYGWNVYRLFFLFLVVIGAPLYPLITLLADLAAGYFERGGDPLQIAKAAFFHYFIFFFVLFAGLIPLVPLNMETAQIRDACGVAPLTQNSNLGARRFEFTETRAPIAPWVAMQLGSGLRSVVSQQLPCVTDLTATNQALRALDISSAEDPAKLRAEQQRFDAECFGPSVQHYQRTLKGHYGQAAANQIRQLSLTHGGVVQTNRELILSLPSSTFLRENFYQKPDFCNALVETDTMYYFCLGLPIKAQGPVDQITGNETSLLSEYQQSINETIPTCQEWFETPNTGLRDRLFEAAERNLADAGSYVLTNPKQLGNVGLMGVDSIAGAVLSAGDLIKNTLGGGDETYRNFMVDRLYTNEVRSGQLLSDQQRDIVNGVTAVGAVGSIAGIFGFDLAESIGQEALSFYTGALIFKAVSALLLPLLLMAVFMFWGPYLIIAEMKGKALMQGVFMIFVLSIVPAIWAIGNHLDDQLYVAMFPQTATLADIIRTPSEHIERLLLDIVSTFFYTVLPLILIYVVVAAGGSSQTTRAYRDSTSDASGTGGRTGGRMAGRTTARAKGSITSKLPLGKGK